MDDVLELTPELMTGLVVALVISIIYMRYSWSKEKATLETAADELRAHRVSQADIRVRAELGQRLLAGARNNDTAEISRAVDLNADVNFVDPSTKAIPLYVATQQGHVDAITTILALSANIDAKNRHGLTALLGAIKSTQFSPKCRNCVTVLLDSGANPNEADADGDTPLLAACRFGDCDYIEALLAHGASVDHRNSRDETAVSLIGSLDDKPLRKRASEVLAKFSQPVHERGNAQSAGDGLRRRGNDADDVDAAEE